MLDRISNGRTDLVFDYLSEGHPATSIDDNGTSLIRWCAYYGDVSAVRFLLINGESLESLGENLDLNGAAFHGHWRLCQFLIENGADVNYPLPDTGETPLHAALCTTNRLTHDHVIRVLIANGANTNCVTKKSAETGGFMRDCRTRAETPLHRAAAFGTEEPWRYGGISTWKTIGQSSLADLTWPLWGDGQIAEKLLAITDR